MTNNIYFLYANHPVIKIDNRYFSYTKNFVDFFIELSKVSSNYNLILPCKNSLKSDVNMEDLVLLDVTDRVNIIEVRSYKGHFGALFTTLINAYNLKKIIRRKSIRKNIYLAGPGPNSMIFWLTYFVPEYKRVFFFIRGDTVKTVQHMYKNKWWGRVPVFISSIFQKRISELLLQDKAQVFTYGDVLKEKYLKYSENVFSIAPLISNDMIIKCESSDYVENFDKIRLLFVGRLSAEKGVFELIEAVNHTMLNGIPIALTIVGNGVLKDKLENFILSNKLENCIKIVGHIASGPKLWNFFDKSDVLCVPSYTEGVPRVIVESFARCVPVMATSVGSVPFMFPEDTVFLKNNSIEEIEKGIKWCYKNKDKLKFKGKHGLSLVDSFVIKNNIDFVNKIFIKL
jgi:glycosyltransferase involved in cell wall biosynthesis